MADEFKVNINITKRVVRLNPDGTRTVISEEALAPGIEPKRIRFSAKRLGLVLLALLGGAQLLYAMWASSSDAKAAKLIASDRACCRVESAAVVETGWSSTRGGKSYWVRTKEDNAEPERTQLAYTSRGWWNQVQRNERLNVKRFVVPGYHISNKILQFSDRNGTGLSRYDPNSGTHYDAMWALVGASMLLVSVVVLKRHSDRIV